MQPIKLNNEQRLALALTSIGSIIAGAWMLIDDAKDLGKFSTPDHPSPIHHWQWGILALIIGVGASGILALDLIRELMEEKQVEG